MNFSELKQTLFARSNFGMKLGLARMEDALALLGEPHRAAPVLHVAGSNGKGSTCAFTESALRAAGLKTGLYTSPHLVHFCERIRIGGMPIPEERAAALLAEILARVPWACSGGPAGATDGDGLTFFELVTLMAFLVFAQEAVDVMVIEVGLGGRLDATNVVSPLACAIAPLALEHTQHLGDTLEQIAAEKAGIIKPGIPVASAGQALAAAEVLEETAARAGALLWRPGRDYRFESRDEKPFCYQSGLRAIAPEMLGVQSNSEIVGMQTISRDGDANRAWTVRATIPATHEERLARDSRSGLSLRGHHQRENAALACALLELAARRGLRVSPEHVEQGLLTAQWPGRMQLAATQPSVFLDGAHNPHGAQALARTLREEFAGQPLQLVFGALADKDLAQTLAPLLPLAAAIHLCAPDSPRALPATVIAAKVYELAPALPCFAYDSSVNALAAARGAAQPSGTVIACGSLYLVGELLAALANRPREAMPSEKLSR